MNPDNNIPLDLNMLANAKHTDAAAHWERAHASMPRYEKYVKNGSLYDANLSAAGLLDNRESAADKNAREGERK